MNIIILGTNGWYDNKTGNTICTLIETDNFYLIFDAGNGLSKLDKYIKNEKKPIYLFLSHLHLDHIEGLHILSKFHFQQGIHIYGQVGTKNHLNKIINSPYTVPLNKLSFKVDVQDLKEGKHEILFKVECKFLVHASPCLGYRIETDNKIITYCTDTGICQEAMDLAKDADLLITECSFKIGQKNEEWPHLNPEDAVKIATESGVEKLILTHFDPSIYRSLDERAEIKEKMKDQFKNIIIAYDDMEIVF